MRFTFEENKIVCSRETTSGGTAHQKDVVSFDAHVDTVPPHVAARLSESEIEQLERFLADSRRLERKSKHRVILEALPGLIDKVGDVLASVEELDASLHEQLVAANRRLDGALSKVKLKPTAQSQSEEVMRRSEAQKKRLNIILNEF